MAGDRLTDLGRLSLPPDEIHLWWVAVPRSMEDLGAAMKLLDAAEHERVQRFLVEPPRRRFVAARAALRVLLGGYLARRPEVFRFAYSEQGKPYLPDSSSDGLGFNVSHSGDFAAVVVARAVELGVDVEQLREVPNAERLAARYFDPREHRFIAGLSGERRSRAFLRCWTSKEAVLKASGRGITATLRVPLVCADPDLPPALAAGEPGAEVWTLLPAGRPGYECVAAVPGHGWQLRVRELDAVALQAASGMV